MDLFSAHCKSTKVSLKNVRNGCAKTPSKIINNKLESQSKIMLQSKEVLAKRSKVPYRTAEPRHPMKPLQRECLKRTHNSTKTTIQLSSANTKENSKNFEVLTHKYYKSDLKQTIIVDRNGNNNLNVSPSKAKDKKQLMNYIKQNDLDQGDDNLFVNDENFASNFYNENGYNQKEKFCKNIIIFDKKEREEIENCALSDLSDNELNDTLSICSFASVSSFNENNKTQEQITGDEFPLFSPRELLNMKK